MAKQAKEAKKLPFYGGYFLHKPILFVKDVDLVRHILVKDFDHFVNRGSGRTARLVQNGELADRIWAKQLVVATGEEWKNVRSTFTPIFTAGKMEAMIILMQETCKDLVAGIDEYASSGQDMELKNILGKYSMDTIASCAFGVNAESFSNKTSNFVAFANKIFESRPIDGLKILMTIIPGGYKRYKLLKALNISLNKKFETEFFYQVIIASLNNRRQTKSRRNDIIDMMLYAIKGDDVDINMNENEEQFEKVYSEICIYFIITQHRLIFQDAKLNHPSNKKTFDEIVVVATAIVFLVAGYDTTAATLAFALYQLAKNPEVQEKLRTEIQEVTNGDLEKNLCYDDLQTMTYLDQVINETLRLHNPVGALNGTTTKDYMMPETDLIIPKGLGVWINVMAIHFDENHYANPHDFDPDHFSKDAKAKRIP